MTELGKKSENRLNNTNHAVVSHEMTGVNNPNTKETQTSNKSSLPVLSQHHLHVQAELWL